jgi:hypothetical protein
MVEEEEEMLRKRRKKKKVVVMPRDSYRNSLKKKKVFLPLCKNLTLLLPSRSSRCNKYCEHDWGLFFLFFSSSSSFFYLAFFLPLPASSFSFLSAGGDQQSPLLTVPLAAAAERQVSVSTC